MQKPHWTPRAEQRLRDLWSVSTSQQVADALGITKRAVESKIERLGLQKGQKAAKPPKSATERLTYGADFSCPACRRNRPLVGSRTVAGQRVCGDCAGEQPGDATVCAGYIGYDCRYQCAPGERVIGGFASLPPGRYLDDERGGRA